MPADDTGVNRGKSRGKGKTGEIVLNGLAASPGIAIGTAHVIPSGGIPSIPLKKISAREVEGEIQRFRTALEQTRRQLSELKENLRSRFKESTTKIFDAHIMMIDDVMAVEQTVALIREKQIGAEQAFSMAIESIVRVISGKQQDQYLRERMEDIRDVERRILANLSGTGDIGRINLEKQAILVAHDLSPSQTAQLDRKLILGCATDVGGTTSHTAILSRSLEIPAVVGLEKITGMVHPGDRIIVDGHAGRVVINPERSTIDQYYAREKQFRVIESRLEELRNLPAKTLDGHFVELSANIEFPEETASVISHGANGVGLFRTEFLYLTRDSLPTEEEQFEAYSEVARRLNPNPVIIRTMDAGADKFSGFFQSEPDPNPFLGNRAIRICLKHKDVFRTQLRALFRATAYGNIKILLPFIATIEELRQALAFVRKVRRELEAEKAPVAKSVKIGIMIEIPSVAVMAKEFMSYVDFVSIGTNDLIQYMLAVDRGNVRVAHLYQPLNPAVIRTLHSVIEAARSSRTWVGVCGEMAGYPSTALLLVGLGVDELSTSPSAIPAIKKLIRSITYEEARESAEKVLSFNSVDKIRNFLEQKVEETDKSVVNR